jgi:DNA helicase-2/ATP-dependent DNA helicase PcrA
VSFLRVYENPKDEVAWLRTLGLQTGIGATTAGDIASQMRVIESVDMIVDGSAGLRIPARGQTGWNDMMLILKNFLEKGRFPAQLIRAVTSSAYQDYLEREYPNWRERLEDLEQLALFAEGYDDLAAFLADISLYDDVIAGRENVGKDTEEKMILSTIHQAKGLEWDTVFIIHLADQSFPNRRALAEEDGMEEERRSFTSPSPAPAANLFLSYPLTLGQESLILNQPSTFIEGSRSALV